MIRINLVSGERKAPAGARGFTLQEAQKVTIGCVMLVVATTGFVGWQYWATHQASVTLDRDIVAAQKEAVRLRLIIAQVQQFEQHKTELQQRVSLIEKLRKEQTGPVHILDQINRAVTPQLWLTEVKQGADANAIVINGKSTNMVALTDFVGNLEASGYFKKSIEILNTRTDTSDKMPGDLVTFSLAAQFQPSGEAPEPPKAPAVAGTTAAASTKG